MGRRPPASAAMAAIWGSPRLLLLVTCAAFCIGFAYGSFSRSLDKVNLVDDSEVQQHKQVESNVAGESLLVANKVVNNPVVGSLRIPRNSGDDGAKGKLKGKKKAIGKEKRKNAKNEKKPSNQRRPKKTSKKVKNEKNRNEASKVRSNKKAKANNK